MTETEKKALALVNEVRAEHGGHPNGIIAKNTYAWDALCRAIEQHEAFRQEVSDAVEDAKRRCLRQAFDQLERLIMPKPDPLQDALDATGWAHDVKQTGMADQLRAALAARGLEIREKQP